MVDCVLQKGTWCWWRDVSRLHHQGRGAQRAEWGLTQIYQEAEPGLSSTEILGAGASFLPWDLHSQYGQSAAGWLCLAGSWGRGNSAVLPIISHLHCSIEQVCRVRKGGEKCRNARSAFKALHNLFHFTLKAELFSGKEIWLMRSM